MVLRERPPAGWTHEAATGPLARRMGQEGLRMLKQTVKSENDDERA